MPYFELSDELKWGGKIYLSLHFVLIPGRKEGTEHFTRYKHYLEILYFPGLLPLLDQGPTVPYYASSIKPSTARKERQNRKLTV
jgi:hypothetical protein